ncbi:MAG: hypothetical protein HYV14_14210 [Elusimicrobia bacterium]|nr:hypothetical protein [Elusimicrobiota bacterium]
MTAPLSRAALVLLCCLAACRNEPAAPPTAEEKDRRELLRQPGPDWKPGEARRALTMLLLIDKTQIRKGDGFAYRLEMQNTGLEPLAIEEDAPSFTKDGSLCAGGGFKFLVTPPGGRERDVPCAPRGAALSTATAATGSGLSLNLQPGEYLLTRASGPGDRFRPMLTTMTFVSLGTYRFKAVYDPEGSFRAESNVVAMEVVP